MIKKLFKKRTKPGFTDFQRDGWAEQFDYIISKWQDTPANIYTYMLPSMIELKMDFPKQTNDKNDLFIGVLAWPSNNCDVIAITKGDIYLEYPLNNQYFGDVDEDFLEKIGVIPTNNTCSDCGEFAIFIDANGKCMDCKIEIQ